MTARRTRHHAVLILADLVHPNPRSRLAEADEGQPEQRRTYGADHLLGNPGSASGVRGAVGVTANTIWAAEAEGRYGSAVTGPASRPLLFLDVDQDAYTGVWIMIALGALYAGG